MSDMNWRLKVLIGILELLIISDCLPYDGRLLCSKCVQTTNTTDCYTYGFCSRGQECSTTEYKMSGNTNQKYFLTGCMSTQECDRVRNSGAKIHMSHLPHYSQIISQSCCNSMGCNAGHFQTHRPICMDCPSQIDPTSCETAQVCDESELCFYQRRLHIDLQSWRHEFSCKGVASCNQIYNVQNALSMNEHCCHGNFCNLMYALEIYNYTSSQQYKPYTTNPSQHTQKTVVTTRPPTTTAPTTTSQPTTTTKPTITTQTTSTTTIRPTSPSTSTTQSSSLTTKCYTQRGRNTPSVITCSGSTPFCINNVTNYQTGSRSVSKGCASASQCYWLTQQTGSQSSYCTILDENSLFLALFECSFCCKDDLCNGQLIPPQETIYVPQPPPSTTQSLTKSTKCYTCTDCGLNQGQENVCSGSSPYCMNEVDNYANGYRRVHKRCVSSLECDTLWLRDTQSNSLCSMFNENFFYAAQFSCSFCCTSDKCNGRILPPQETLYINHVV